MANDLSTAIHEVTAHHDAVLELSAERRAIMVDGVDMIHRDVEGEISELNLMLRALKEANLVHHKVGEMLLTFQK